MSAKKKKLKTTIKKLRSKLEGAEKTARRSQSKAAGLKETNAELKAQIRKLKKSNKRLAAASRPAEPPKIALSHGAVVAVDSPKSDQTVTPAVASPDGTWTVAQLREEARSRGLTGLSHKTKAQLLAALG